MKYLILLLMTLLMSGVGGCGFFSESGKSLLRKSDLSYQVNANPAEIQINGTVMKKIGGIAEVTQQHKGDQLLLTVILSTEAQASTLNLKAKNNPPINSIWLNDELLWTR